MLLQIWRYKLAWFVLFNFIFFWIFCCCISCMFCKLIFSRKTLLDRSAVQEIQIELSLNFRPTFSLLNSDRMKKDRKSECYVTSVSGYVRYSVWDSVRYSDSDEVWQTAVGEIVATMQWFHVRIQNRFNNTYRIASGRRLLSLLLVLHATLVKSVFSVGQPRSHSSQHWKDKLCCCYKLMNSDHGMFSLWNKMREGRKEERNKEVNITIHIYIYIYIYIYCIYISAVKRLID